ncbi:MAG: hypothetical protein KA711_14525 [Ideonella sp. WA131b]|jgi:hypothetical protein|nr:hypothetical protein [Ideonella sp. WA131b]
MTPAEFDARRAALHIALACGVLALPTLGALAVDARQLSGVSVWAKPLKFQVSLALHWATVALLLSLLDPARQGLPLVRWALRIGAFATLVELLYIVLQAARGRASHFNNDTWLEAFLYTALMGTGALLIVATTAAVGVALWRHPRERPNADRRDSLWLGAVLGLLGGSIATLLVAVPLSSGVIAGPGPWVGGVPGNGAGLPLLGWSTTGGDLRVPHFVATHLVQALPLAGWLMARGAAAGHWPTRRARAGVWAAAALGFGLVALTMAQAVSGQPLLALGDGPAS